MCGLLGFYRKNENAVLDRPTFAKMLDTLSFRGPDEKTIHEDGPIFLGHTRLKVIDLSTGTQPIFNEDKTVSCVFNGEIYNYQVLREDLVKKGHRFTSTSDTEVIVHLYEEEGEKVFQKLEGMFAIVLYDRKLKKVLVGRDRMGEKPLYYVDDPNFFACASELKALLAHPAVDRSIDFDALAAYLSSMYVPAPLSIFKKIRKLRPGAMLILQASVLQEVVYWAPSLRVRTDQSEEEILQEIRDRLDRSVKNRIKADVPLGVFLSGGLDSSAVVAFMARHSNRPVQTYSIGFGSINELPFARQVAEKYGTQHTEIVLSGKVEEELPRIVSTFDEPFADTSNIPTFLISKEARKHVTVVLTGDGGDELFAGYDLYNDQKYYSSSRIKSRVARLSEGLLNSWYPMAVGNGSWDYWMRHRSIFQSNEVERLLKRPFRSLSSTFARPGGMTIQDQDPLSRAFSFDLKYYLPDDLLKKVDMAAMAHGLECRAPFLDHTLVEYAMTIQPLWKLKGRQTKYLLREAMKDLLPASVISRDKQGFGIPITEWMRGPLKSSIDEAVSDGKFLKTILDPAEIKRVHQTGMQPQTSDWRAPFQLWSLYMLELWAREYRPVAA